MALARSKDWLLEIHAHQKVQQEKQLGGGPLLEY
jgi:hypothetical protein